MGLKISFNDYVIIQWAYHLMILWFQKIVFHNKIINKMQRTKSQENSTHLFGVNYLKNRLAKFLQDRIKPKS